MIEERIKEKIKAYMINYKIYTSVTQISYSIVTYHLFSQMKEQKTSPELNHPYPYLGNKRIHYMKYYK